MSALALLPLNQSACDTLAEADSTERLNRIRQRRLDHAITTNPILSHLCDHAGATARIEADMNRRSLILQTLAEESR